MTIISKEAFKISCESLMHPYNKSCTKGAILIAIGSFAGTAKYMLPIYLISMLIKYKKEKWTSEFLILQINSFLRTTLMGSWMASSFISINCILRSLLSRYSYYTISFIPALFGGLGVFVEHPNRRPILMNAYTNWGIQGFLASLYKKKILQKSLFLETLLFMTSNAYLMYQLQQSPSQLWVYKPPLMEKDSKTCSHKGECYKDIIREYLKYLGYGFLFDLIRTLIMNSSKIVSSPKTLRKLLFNRNILRLGNFLGCYVAIYKIICCLLCYLFKQNDTRYAIIAGFFAGQAYLLLPKHSFLAPTINQAIQTCFRKTALKPSYLNKMPIGEIMFALSNAYLFHLRVLEPDSCPYLFKKMMNICSSGSSDDIYLRYKRCLDQSSQGHAIHLERSGKC